MIEGVGISSISNEGTLVYIPGSFDARRNLTLLWVDREGNEEAITDIPGQWVDIAMSYDGTKVALAYGVDGNSDIQIWDIAREIMSRLTFNAAEEYTPLWTPDSRRIVFTSERDGKWGIYWKAADGTGETELLASVPEDEVWPWSGSEDGKTLLLTQLVQSSRQADIEILSMEGDRARKALLNTEYAEAGPQISPDGRWMAYTSNESGQPQIYVRTFPEVNEGKWQVSQGGGHSPLWSPDGRELFYRNDDATIAVSVETEPTFGPGKAKILFQEEYYSNPLAGVPTTAWDISTDGKRFIMAKEPQFTDSESADEAPRKINVIVNWFEELKERVPVY
jgi:serine/threonine-protein kinase